MRGKKSMLRQIIFLAGITLAAAGCAPKKEKIPVADEGINVPVQQFSNATLYFYNKQYVQWTLDAKLMRKPLTDTGSILVVPVRLNLFDSLGVVKTKVLADSGLISNKMDSYVVWGDVFIRARDSMIVRTQKLKWFKNQRKVQSDTYVQIETINGDILRGKGLDAAEDFSHFKFTNDVTGKFPDFKKRLENEESVF